MVDINDTEVIGGADAMASIAQTDADTGSGADAVTTQEIQDLDTGTGVDADVGDREIEDRDWATGHEFSFGGPVYMIEDTETISGADSQQPAANPITDSDTVQGTDGQTSPVITTYGPTRRWSLVPTGRSS